MVAHDESDKAIYLYMCVLLSEGYFPLQPQFKTSCSSPVYVGQSALFAIEKCKEFPEIRLWLMAYIWIISYPYRG